MLKSKSKKLGEILLELEYINQKQLDETITRREKSQKRIGEIMLDLGFINEGELSKALEHQLGITQVDLNYYNLSSELIQYIPENMARHYNIIPLEVNEDHIKVAMTDPFDLIAMEDIKLASGFNVKPFIASASEIKQAINRLYAVADSEANEIFNTLLEKQESSQELNDPELEQGINDAPIVRLTNIIIGQAIQLRASDIHVEPGPKNVRVRYRIDGVLRENMTVPKYSQAPLISRIKIIADLDITKRLIPQDGRIHFNYRGEEINMRVSSLPAIHGEKLVIRLLTQNHQLLEIKNLGFSENNFHLFRDLIDRPHGIILTTGPTGSGKSTTLFAALNSLNSSTQNIITVEDPVEYQIEGINQIQARTKVGLTFARTLRSILRQDPDIIMVGEMRDEETSQIAVRAALTGHLVLSTLHTNDAISSITRLLDMGIPSYLVASTINGIIAQRLVRKLCPECKQEYNPGPVEKQALDLADTDTIFKPGKCKQCNDIGYRGRLAIQEILMLDETVKEMIVKGNSENEIKKYAKNNGLITLRQDGINKVKNGLTSYEEIMRINI
ncbi:MAG: GspE/PulE family protein [Halanaerobiaceae bacterium]